MYDLIIVGGGPAGLTAAAYALRKRLNVLLVSKDLGGKTNYRLGLPWVEDYQVIRGLEVVNKFKSELEYLDFARNMEPVECITRQEDVDGPYFTVQTKSGGSLQTRAVIIATGTKQRRMDVPGEKDYIMRGLCYSALSYAPLFIDRETVVIGDGDLALRSVAELATVAKKVSLVRANPDGAGSPLLKKVQGAANVCLLDGYQVTAVKGDEYARSVMVKDPNGREMEIVADGTFVELDLIPNTQMVADLVELDGRGRIKVDCGNRTNVPGIFAAGDATDVYAEQVLVAIGEGAKAALSAYDYLLPKL